MAYRMKGFSGFSDLIQDAAMMTGKKVKEMATAMRDGSLAQGEKKIRDAKRETRVKYTKRRRALIPGNYYEPGTISKGKIIKQKRKAKKNIKN